MLCPVAGIDHLIILPEVPPPYNNVVSRTVIRGIRMTECRFDMKPEALEVDPSIWFYSVRGELAEVFPDVETGKLYGTFVFEVVCRHRRKRLLVASARYLVSYAVQGAFEPDVGALFVERVGRVAAYPYFGRLSLRWPPSPGSPCHLSRSSVWPREGYSRRWARSRSSRKAIGNSDLTA